MLSEGILGLIREALRLINNLLEARPPEVRAAQSIQWFQMWWPLTRLFIPGDARVQIEGIMKAATHPAATPESSPVQH